MESQSINDLLDLTSEEKLKQIGGQIVIRSTRLNEELLRLNSVHRIDKSIFDKINKVINKYCKDIEGYRKMLDILLDLE